MMERHERAKYERLHKAVREVLTRDWDPLGVGDNPSLQDEYDSYVGPVCRFLLSGGEHKAISDYLRQVQQIDLGLLLIDAERDRKIAGLLISLSP
jgi:hypothetical protein